MNPKTGLAQFRLTEISGSNFSSLKPFFPSLTIKYMKADSGLAAEPIYNSNCLSDARLLERAHLLLILCLIRFLVYLVVVCSCM